MFSLDVVDTDRFLDLPSSSQALYFHLGMRADDDGFVSSPKRITTAVNCSADDMKLLIAKGFIIPFSSGVCVIRDWKTNNYLRGDRHTPTRYIAEKSSLGENNGAYQLIDDSVTLGIPDVNQLVDVRDTQYRLDKNRIEGGADKPPRTRFVPPTLEEVRAYCRERGNNVDAQRFIDHYEANGWVQGKGKPIKDWKAAVRTWENNGMSGSGNKRQPQHRERWTNEVVSPQDIVENPDKPGEWIPRSELEGRA